MAHMIPEQILTFNEPVNGLQHIIRKKGHLIHILDFVNQQ
jgi:hypothetical protein